jgi:metallophosphoesterase (TIGR00282 family)
MSLFTVVFIADISGKAGRQATAHMAGPLREKYQADYLIANVENAAGGFGITPEMSRKIFSYGVDLQTSGNHIWDRVDILRYFDEEPRLLRPANYPPMAPGKGNYIDEISGVKIGVLNVQGRTFMADTDCPFRIASRELSEMSRRTDLIFVDFHAEATSEKQAMLHHLDGRVSAIVGTHTHVQTADEHITPNGTAFITDAGMTGAHDSIIGMEKGSSLGRFMTAMPKRFTSASGDAKISGVVVQISADTGKAKNIERFRFDFDIERINGSQTDISNDADNGPIPDEAEGE